MNTILFLIIYIYNCVVTSKSGMVIIGGVLYPCPGCVHSHIPKYGPH